jgi:hypothetical protein
MRYDRVDYMSPVQDRSARRAPSAEPDMAGHNAVQAAQPRLGQCFVAGRYSAFPTKPASVELRSAQASAISARERLRQSSEKVSE